ncbi:SIS domain-containing protein [Acidobacteria bacterium AH-259-G07]|nr:SIS domain-containing protein [Acidobacteria bacterium AH-259-G07]
MNPALAYLDAAQAILERIRATQVKALERAADICTQSISEGGLVHLFGTGHSRMPVEEMFPRHGSFPGFHPILELSLSYHHAEGMKDRVGPGSTIGAAAVVNALKCLVADGLTRLGQPPMVLTSSYFIGTEASSKQFDECYDDYRRRVRRVYG